jgi:hypothetical protein
MASFFQVGYSRFHSLRIPLEESTMLKFRNVLAAAAVMLLFIGPTFAAATDRSSVALVSTSAHASGTTVSLNKSNSDCPPAAAQPCKTYKPCSISYCGCCDCCGPKASQTLLVKDPCDCCCQCAEIPVCLPASCQKPCICSRCGLFGRSIVTYSYSCGCCVTIVFRRCGDVVVKYG